MEGCFSEFSQFSTTGLGLTPLSCTFPLSIVPFSLHVKAESTMSQTCCYAVWGSFRWVSKLRARSVIQGKVPARKGNLANGKMG